MRIAFYAPLKPPASAVPSGDRRMARLLLQALAMAGHEAELASSLRMHDPTGDGLRQAELAAEAEAEAARLLASYKARPEARPQAWLTYHVYHKAPDIIGPLVASALDLPYLIAEPSVAGKRRSGPWADGFARAAAAIARADMLLCLTRHDMQGVATIARQERLRLLPPFLDHRPFAAARAAADGGAGRPAVRAALAARYGLDPARAWLLAVGMFRAGDKLESYRRLAAALARLEAAVPPWQLLVAGAGPAEAEVRAALALLASPVAWLGQVAEADLPALYAASDLYVWPAANEAYGMALLEAAAAGCPVVSCATRGVPDVVWQGETGLLVEEDRPAALAGAISALLQDAPRRRRMGAAAAARVAEDRSLAAASRRLDAALADAVAHRAAADAAGTG